MKSFFWKFVLCLLPCALAAWAVIAATLKYQQGESGGFKFGVDLEGGTILVYEIDVRRTTGQSAGEKQSGYDPKDVSVLAESLKRRIDPNDLYNIVIRPAPGEGRIEIILPTGGVYRMQKAEENWQQLLREMAREYLLAPADRDDEAKIKAAVERLQVGRGHILELADRIQITQAQEIWEKKLFGSDQAWQQLKKNARDYWAELDLMLKPESKKEFRPELAKKWEALPQGKLRPFETLIFEALLKTPAATSEKTVKTWVRQQAWEEMMARARAKWLEPEALREATQKQLVKGAAKKGEKKEVVDEKLRVALLRSFKEEMERIPTDNIEQLVTYIQARGNVIAQGGLALLEPLMGDVYGGPSREEVRSFIRDNYGPSADQIVKDINARMRQSGHNRDLSVEEVQRIKDLVSKVGKLEFRILANSRDDKAGVEAALKLINEPDAQTKKDLEEAQQKGLPPPAPRQKFDIVLANKAASKVTYSWVELGPQERKQLHLNNAARTDPEHNAPWVEATSNLNKAIRLPAGRGAVAGDLGLLEGALFFARKCEDRNLPEEERRRKQYEYFVLARDPEFDPQNERVRTPAITGDYLSGAYNAPGADGRPTVHFAFNNDGANLFGDLTRKNVVEGSGPENTKVRRHLAIILDGLVMSAPTIQSEIRSQGTITGDFSAKEVDSLVNILRAGRLPATLKPQPVSESTVGATLGADTITAGVEAILAAFVVVLVFMVIYYRFAGFVASVALLANLLLTVGFMVAVQATFTLPGLAGLVLMLGMAVDANVLIYERLREERERGASLAQAIRNGYSRALPTIIDTHLSSIFTAIVLYVVGNDQLKGFAVSLTVGLLISLFTSLYMTHVMFDFWLSKGWLTKLSMLRFFARPNLDFMRIRYAMFGVTLVVSILGIALFIGRLPNDLDIDFTGGTAYGGQLTEARTISALRELLGEERQKSLLAGVVVKELPNTQGRSYTVTYPGSQPVTVTLVNPPEMPTAEQRALDVQQRASQLPDPSVEMSYPSSQDPAKLPPGASHFFTVRTSEKEVELVQTALDQLLQDSGKELLQRVFMVYSYDPATPREARLYFYAKQPPKGVAPAELEKQAESNGTTWSDQDAGSPTFVKSLLNRELRRIFGLYKSDEQLPFVFEVAGEGRSTTDLKYHVMKVTFSPELKTKSQIDKVREALQQTRDEFASRPQPDRLENFDSQLATDTRFRALWAVLASWAAILVYLWFRFGNWTFGLAAVACLVHDLFFTLGAIAACHYLAAVPVLSDILMLRDFKVDLNAVAALLTLVGYSVNDTIVVFDRIREVRGKNPDLTPKMINDSINQTLSRTILASFTTFLVVFVLYVWGGPGVHLFAFVMVIGVFVGTYSSIYIASPLLLMLGEGTHEEPRAGETRPQPQSARA